MRTVHLDGGKHIGDPVLDRRRHAACVVFEQQARALAKDLVRDGRIGREQYGPAVAAVDDRRDNWIRAALLSVLEEQNADGPRALDRLVAQHVPEHIPELVEPSERLAPMLRS